MVLLMADVDGTLLDERGALPLAPHALRTYLARVAAARGQPIVFGLASSRTLDELRVLQRILGIDGPCIAEDGGVVAVDASSTHQLGVSADALRSRLSSFAPELSPYVLTVDNASALARLGFRTHAMRRRAIGARRASVLLDLESLDARVTERLRRACQAHGLALHRGGRWHTLTGGAGKGKALTMLRAHHPPAGAVMHVVAVGNEENDVTLLEASDAPFAINNPGRGAHPALLALPGVIALRASGTAGFVELLDRLSDPAKLEAV